MSPFEFVTVLISIILGLGITQIMSGIADLIHQWDKTKIYWPHVLWVILVFVLHVQQWWLTYQLRDMVVWRLPFFLFEVLYPISLFILARILFPLTGDETSNDMKVFYFRHYRKFFLLVMILSVLSALENIFIHNLGVAGWLVNLVLFAGLLVVAVKKIKTERLHEAIALLLLTAMTAGIIININEWLITA
ncbi:MAG: hypothetical protein SH819_13415 [Cytophagales bacterium]|nr:hypothetical protein [Cytophagales bacterium]